MEAPEVVSGKFLAKVWGVDERTVRKLVANRIAVRVGRGRCDLAASARNYADRARRRAPIPFDEIFGGGPSAVTTITAGDACWGGASIAAPTATQSRSQGHRRA
jgi:hypothetical protein